MNRVFVCKLDNFSLQMPNMCGSRVFRFECALNFANFDYFREALVTKTGLDPLILRKRLQKLETQKNCGSDSVCVQTTDTSISGLQQEGHIMESSAVQAVSVENLNKCTHVGPSEDHLVLDCSSWSYIDYTATQLLNEVFC